MRPSAAAADVVGVIAGSRWMPRKAEEPPIPVAAAAAWAREGPANVCGHRTGFTRHDADRPRSRARQAARHAERLYPGALGRLVAHELVTYAECAAGPGGLAESVITEVLDRTPPRSAG